MGRPRLYFTPEARAAANRAKSKKHYSQYVGLFNLYLTNAYYSRNRASICLRARKKYLASVAPVLPPITAVRTLRQKIDAAEQKYVRITGVGIRQYLSSVYTRYCNYGGPAESRTHIISEAL